MRAARVSASANITLIRSRSRSSCRIEQHLIPLHALPESRPHKLKRVGHDFDRAAQTLLQHLLDVEQIAVVDPGTALQTHVDIALRACLPVSARAEKAHSGDIVGHNNVP